MGTMSRIEAAVDAVGGEDHLDPGDIILMNDPYKTGSHPQDAAVAAPVFLDDETLIGYSAIKAHWMDIGAKQIYRTDTTDIWQEGTIFPGVKLYRSGRAPGRTSSRWRSRTPLAGDLRRGGHQRGDRRRAHRCGRLRPALLERYGLERFGQSVERMFDHGEAVVRNYFEQIPDGRYVGYGEMDNDGISDDPIPFEVVLEVEGSTCRLDFSSAPDSRP